jgi:hypothetical protein
MRRAALVRGRQGLQQPGVTVETAVVVPFKREREDGGRREAAVLGSRRAANLRSCHAPGPWQSTRRARAPRELHVARARRCKGNIACVETGVLEVAVSSPDGIRAPRQIVFEAGAGAWSAAMRLRMDLCRVRDLVDRQDHPINSLFDGGRRRPADVSV